MCWFYIPKRIHRWTACVVACLPVIASADTVPVTFAIDAARSSFTLDVTVETAFGTKSDSDSSTISGTGLAHFTIDPSAGTPRIEALEFAGPVAGNRYVIDETLEYDFTFLIFFNVHAIGSDLAGYPDTLGPPAPVTAIGSDDLHYEFDAALHEFTLNEGTLVYSGTVEGSLDLASDPQGGAPPAGTMGSIQLTQGATHNDLTEFTAELVMPADFTDSYDDPDTGITVTWDVRGTLYGTGVFSIDIGLGGIQGDFDQDGDVDGKDFLIWQDGFGIQSGATRGDGDANGDGAVNGNDLAFWQSNFGSLDSALHPIATMIPEPTTWLLAVLLLAPVPWRRSWITP